MVMYLPRTATSIVRGANFIDRIFTESWMAREGLPVRRGLPTILANASLADTYAVACRRDQRTIQFGPYWFFADQRHPFGEVIGIDEKGAPILGFRMS